MCLFGLGWSHNPKDGWSFVLFIVSKHPIVTCLILSFSRPKIQETKTKTSHTWFYVFLIYKAEKKLLRWVWENTIIKYSAIHLVVRVRFERTAHGFHSAALPMWTQDSQLSYLTILFLWVWDRVSFITYKSQTLYKYRKYFLIRQTIY